MLVLALLSYVLVQIHVDYPECVQHMQIWGHYSLYILYVLCSACKDLWMSVLRMRNYMFGSSLLLVRNLLIFVSGLYVIWMLVFLNIFISVLTCGPVYVTTILFFLCVMFSLFVLLF